MRAIFKPKKAEAAPQKRKPLAGLGMRRSMPDQAAKTRELLQALNSTSQSARTSWLFFVSFQAYLFVAVASVTHTDLLLNSSIKLPLLQIEIPLGSFFLVSPLLLILTHFGVLLHHAVLKRKAQAFDNLIGTDEGADAQRLRLEVSSYFFTQNEAGPRRGLILRLLLNTMAFVTINLLPSLLLLYFQITFLPAHDTVSTWLHRSYVILDVAVLFLIGLSTLSRNSDGTSAAHFGIKLPRLSCAVSVVIVLFSMCVATLPSDIKGWSDLDAFMTRIWPVNVPINREFWTCAKPDNRCAFILTALLFEKPIDYVSSRRPGFSRSLVVTEKNVALGTAASPVKVALRGRDLRYATFDRSDLRGADFTAADLTGASLKGTDLRETVFGCAIRGKKLSNWTTPEGNGREMWVDDETCPSLREANLTEAKLSDRTINRAVLSDANLTKINMRGFDLRGVDFSNASLVRADLTNANLSGAKLDGSNLNFLMAGGASFHQASLRAADLTNADLGGSILTHADLSGADMSAASLVGTVLVGTRFFAANLSHTRIWGSIPPRPKAFSLTTTFDLNFTKPEQHELDTIVKDIKAVTFFPIDENSYVPQRSRDFLETGNWSASEERTTWLDLRRARQKSSDAQQALGGYLAELGCKSEPTLRGILDTHLMPRGYDIYEDFVPVPPIPQGVTLTDLEETYDDVPEKQPARKWIRYGDHPLIFDGFLNKVRELECETRLQAAGASIETLVRAGKDAKMGETSAAVRVVRFSPAFEATPNAETVE